MKKINRLTKLLVIVSFLLTLFLSLKIGSVVEAQTEPEWEQVGLSGVSITSLVNAPSDSQRMYASSTNVGGGIFRSDDGGTTWISVKNNLPGLVAITGLAVHPDDANIVLAGSLQVGTFTVIGSIYRTINGGASWQRVASRQTGNFWSVAFDPTNPNLAYGVDGNGSAFRHIYKSTNGGASWFTSVETGLTAFDPISIYVDPSNTQTLYVTSGRNGVFKSIDSGESWYAANVGIPGSRIETMAIDPSNTQNLYVGVRASGGFYESIDGGTLWSQDANGLGGNWVQAVTLDEVNPSNLFAAVNTSSRQGLGVYMTSDSGGSWQAINNGLPVSPPFVNILTVNESNRNLFIGTVDGIWRIALSINTPPKVLLPINDFTIDATAQTHDIPLLGVFTDLEDDDFQITLGITAEVISNPNLLTATIVQDGVNVLLRIDYAGSLTGTATVEIRATDSGGLTTSHLFNIEISDTVLDTDGDGLLDIWEEEGTELYNLGARPDRQDIFVEIDWMEGFMNCEIASQFLAHKYVNNYECSNSEMSTEPSRQAIQTIINAFESAVVPYPDGTNGDIVLHVDFDGTCSDGNPAPLRYTLATDDDESLDWTGFQEIKNDCFSQERARTHHYALFALSFSEICDIGGISRGIPSSDLIVTPFDVENGTCDFGNLASENFQSINFMHELGHNLGLRHGGDDSVVYKPNYLSIMNYSFSTDAGIPSTNSEPIIDYSHIQLSPLDERNLDENIGLGIRTNDLEFYDTFYFCPNGNRRRTRAINPINWDCDVQTILGVEIPFSQNYEIVNNIDINGDIVRNQPQNTILLESWDDWENLILNGGGQIGSGDFNFILPLTTELEEPTLEELEEIEEFWNTPFTDLIITVTTTANLVNVNEIIQYEISIENQSNIDASNVILGIIVSNNGIVSENERCTLANNMLLCEVGDLPSTVSSQISIEVTAISAGNLVIDFGTTSETPDLDEANNVELIEVDVNSSPSISVFNSNLSYSEGTTAENTINVTDNENDIVSVSTSIGAIWNTVDDIWQWSYTPTDGPADSQTVTITADDGNGGITEEIFELVVENVAPTATFVNIFDTEPVFQGNGTILAFINSADVSSEDVNAGFDYAVICDSNNTSDTQIGTDTNYTCIYPTAGLFTVTGMIRDKDAGISTYTVDVEVLSPIDAISYIDGLVSDLFNQSALNQGQANALSRKLSNASQQLARNNTQATIDNLNGFIIQVNEFVADGILTDAQGNSLIAPVQRLITSVISL